MSTFLYRSAQVKLNDGTWTWTELPVFGALVDANYAPNREHTTLDVIPANAFVQRDMELTRLRDTNDKAKGVFATLEAFLDGREVVSLVLYSKGDTDAESELIYFSDDGLGFPFIPQGFDYGVAYRQDLGGFFDL